MSRAIGTEEFWQVYQELDERGAVWVDFGSLLLDIASGPRALNRVGAFMRAAPFWQCSAAERNFGGQEMIARQAFCTPANGP